MPGDAASPCSGSTSEASDRTPNSLFAEILAEAQVLTALPNHQRLAWVSGLALVCHHRDDVVEFCQWLASNDDDLSAHLLAALSRIGPSEQRTAVVGIAAQGRHNQSSEAPLEATAAWRVANQWSQSVVIGWGSETGDNFSVLAEVGEDGTLVDLLLGEFAEQMIAGLADDSAAGVQIETWDVAHAVDVVASAWHAAAEQSISRSDGLRANAWFVASQLDPLVNGELPDIVHFEEPVDLLRGMTTGEFADANAAARSTLRAALGDGAVERPVDGRLIAAWKSVVTANVEGVDAHERDGLLFLEWADWLGIGIGLSRDVAPVQVSASVFVDYINRCPEVSSTISARDREYTEWALARAIELLREHGALTDSTFDVDQQQAVAPALWASWS